MINSFFGYKKVFILICLLLLIFGTILVMVFSGSQTGQPQVTVPKTDALKTPPFVPRNITINQTPERDIANLPNLKRKEASASGQTKYFLSSERTMRDDLIVTKNNTAIFERKVTDSRDPNQPILEEITAQYGEPEMVKVGSYHYGDNEKVLVFAKLGFALLLDPYTNYIDEIQKFSPTTPEQYLSSWGEDIYKEPGLPSE